LASRFCWPPEQLAFEEVSGNGQQRRRERHERPGPALARLHSRDASEESQSREGLGLTALEAGASLLPLSAALLALALSASAVAARVGLRNAMTGGMALIAIASTIIGVAIAGGGMVLLAIGFFVMGTGLALPYASAPRLALSALSPAQAGQGSGIVNACTFLAGLAGSGGVAGGAIAFALGGFVAVLTMIALTGIIGGALSRGIPETA
jgi:MFS family permease